MLVLLPSVDAAIDCTEEDIGPIPEGHFGTGMTERYAGKPAKIGNERFSAPVGRRGILGDGIFGAPYVLQL